MKIESPFIIKLMTVLSIVSLFSFAGLFMYGNIATITASNNQALPSTTTFTFSMSGTEFTISDIMKDPTNNGIVIVSKSKNTEKLGYAKGFLMYIQGAKVIDEARTNVYVYPDGYMIINVDSIDDDFLTQLGLRFTIRANQSIVKTTNKPDKTTYDVFDQADIVVNTSAITKTVDSTDVESIYKKYACNEDTETVSEAKSLIEQLAVDKAKYEDRLTLLETTYDIQLDNPPAFVNDVISDDFTSVDTSYVLSRGVNMDVDDIQSYLDANSLSSASNLKDHLDVILAQEKPNGNFNTSDLTFSYISSGKPVDVNELTSNASVAVNNTLNALVGWYKDIYELQTSKSIKILSNYCDIWTTTSEYASFEDINTMLY